MRRFGISAVLVCAVSSLASAAGQEIVDPDNVDQARYEACLAEIDVNPLSAYETGLAWRAQAGGWPAAHCTALAIVATGDFTEGARRLEATGEGAISAGEYGRAVMLGQAGDAWLAAEKPAEALRAFTRGADFAPGDAGLALGQAEAALGAGLFELAETAASRAISLDETNADAYRLRSRARLEQGALINAQADLNAALDRDPDNIDTLLLRGDIRQAMRD